MEASFYRHINDLIREREKLQIKSTCMIWLNIILHIVLRKSMAERNRDRPALKFEVTKIIKYS